ncbi:MAG: hypothetical protein WBI92_09865 [Cloacibacterium sp.]|uniref:hypothetical protein n=1 Tax=Cloacibacterium sp. TaxID=1913682 RepID=UPI003C766E7C
MENQEKKQKGNQEYSQERKQEHKQNNGLELLKKVIETNERNTEQGIKTEFVYEDLLNIKGETESTMRRFNATILKLSESLEKETQERNEFIERIPKTIEIVPSEDYLNLNKSFEKNSKLVKIIFYGMIAALFLSVIITAGNIFFTKQWYVESIKSKSEIRQEILDEIKKDGQSIYKDEDYLQLQHNTELMNKWMNKNPKDAEKFLRFKDGYESR